MNVLSFFWKPGRSVTSDKRTSKSHFTVQAYRHKVISDEKSSLYFVTEKLDHISMRKMWTAGRQFLISWMIPSASRY